MTLAVMLMAVSAPSAEPCFRFEACVDGSEYLHILGGELRVEHRNWTPLGRHSDCSAWGTVPVPALVNGLEWQPVWPAGFCTGCISDPFDLMPPMPMEESVELVQLAGDGPASITQTPSAANGFETVVLLDDDGHGGATWFSIEIYCGCRPPGAPDIAVLETPCSPGVALDWADVVFPEPSRAGTYNVFRSELDCADALSQPALVTGLMSSEFTDLSAAPFVNYVYVVQAEGSGTAPVGCDAGQGHGGPAATGCLDGAGHGYLEPDLTLVGNHLRLRPDPLSVASFAWSTAPALSVEETWAVFGSADVQAAFTNITPGGLFEARFEEGARPGPLYFYDVRVVDSCGAVSSD